MTARGGRRAPVRPATRRGSSARRWWLTPRPARGPGLRQGPGHDAKAGLRPLGQLRLDPLPGIVLGLDQAPPGRLDVGDLGSDLRPEPGVGSGQPGSIADRRQQAQIIEDGRVVDDHADRASVDRDRRDCSTTARRRDIDRSAVGIHVARRTLDRVANIECRVAQGQRKGVAHGRRGCVSQLDDQVRDSRPTPGFSEQSNKEPDRDAAERHLIRRQGGIDERSVGPGKTHRGDPDHPEAERRRSRDGPRPRTTGRSECCEGAPDGCADDRSTQRRLVTRSRN